MSTVPTLNPFTQVVILSGKIMNKVLVSIFLAFLMIMGSGCSRMQGIIGSFTDHEVAVNFTITEVNASGQSGNFSLKGDASLPDQTRLAVSAVRKLNKTSSDNGAAGGKPSYAILDRQFALVKDGQWQANLTLKQLDANGSGFENWQFETDLLQTALDPSSTVSFLVTLEPTSFSKDIEQLLTNAAINQGDTQLNFTTDGDAYLQISQSMAIPIPSGTVAQSDDSTLAQNIDLWQGRSDYSPSAGELGEQPQLPFDEDDNWPLPTSNIMQ